MHQPSTSGLERAGALERVPARCARSSSVALMISDRFLDLRLDVFDAESCTLLHRWVRDEAFAELFDLLLQEHKAPHVGPLLAHQEIELVDTFS